MTRSWLIGTIGRVVTFGLALVCESVLNSWDAAAHPDEGANIGSALVGMFVLVSGAAIWGGIDGARILSLPLVLARWTLVAVVALIVGVVSGAGPYVAGLIAFPALLSGTFFWVVVAYARRHPEPAR